MLCSSPCFNFLFFSSIYMQAKLMLVGNMTEKTDAFILVTNWGTDGGGPHDNDCEEAKFSLLLCFNEVWGIGQSLPKLSVFHDYLGICESLDICFLLVDKNVASRLLPYTMHRSYKKKFQIGKATRLSVHVWTLHYVYSAYISEFSC
jgi:hypothetical protein